MVEHARLEALLIDFDGTLVDLSVRWDHVRADLRSAVKNWGMDSDFRPLGPEIERVVAAVGRIVSTQEAQHALHSIVRTHELAAARRVRPLAGAANLLAWACERAFPLAVVSSNSVDAIGQVFDQLSWTMPTVVIGRESVSRLKPDPEGARAALRALGATPEAALVVGDRDDDIRLGRAIHARTARIAPVRTNDAAALNADYEFASLDSLVAALATLTAR